MARSREQGRGWWLLLWLLIGGCSQPEPQRTESHRSGEDRECIDEPIFSGRVCLYEINRGAEESVILIHGLNGEAERDWREQFDVLGRQYHVLAIDLPGFGASSRGANDYNPERYARLLHFIAEHRIGRPSHLIGHSMGGAIALYYAALYPEWVEQLVVADVAGILHPVALAKSVVRGWITGSTDGNDRVGGWIERMSGRFLEKMEPVAHSAKENGWLSEEPSAIAAQGLIETNYSGLLERVVAPTLIVWGAEDSVAPLRTAEVLKWRLPNARLAVVEGAGHMVMQDQPQQFNRRIVEFLQEGVGERHHPVAKGDDHRGEWREIDCHGKKGGRIDGPYLRIRLKNCSGLVIHEAEIGTIEAIDSQFYLERSRVGGGPIGLDLTGSDVTITASEIVGEVALRAVGSRIDMAAVDISGTVAAIEALHRSRLIFSVVRIKSPHHRRYFHDNIRVSERRLF